MRKTVQSIARLISGQTLRRVGMGRQFHRRLLRKQKRVLLLKTWDDRLGDLVLISGTLRHYRHLYADCRLELACADPLIDYFKYSPHVDSVVPLTEFGTSNERYADCSRWNAGRYDDVISLRRTPRVLDYKLINSFKPAWTAGITGDHLLISPAEAKKCEARLSCAVASPDSKTPVHELEMQARMLQQLGADVHRADDIWPECWTNQEDERAARRWLPNSGSGRPFIVWAPCGSAAIRDWNTSGYRKLFESMPECLIAMVGTGRDAEYARSMVWDGLVGRERIDLIGQTTIRELVEIVRRADLVLSAESAVFHLAATLKRPAICLAGGGHWGRFVPWGMPDRTRVLTQRLTCFGCGWRCTRPTVECLQQINPDEVAQCAQELLAQTR